MKIIGAEEALATGSTKGKTATAHYVFNNSAKAAVKLEMQPMMATQAQ